MLLKYLFRKDFYGFLRSVFSASYTQYNSLQLLRERSSGLVADTDIKLVSPGRISLGKNVKLNKGVYINCGHHEMNGEEGRITLGNNVVLGVYVVLFAGKGNI